MAEVFLGNATSLAALFEEQSTVRKALHRRSDGEGAPRRSKNHRRRVILPPVAMSEVGLTLNVPTEGFVLAVVAPMTSPTQTISTVASRPTSASSQLAA